MSYHNLRKIHLVTGAARSGKSEWAEILAINTNKSVIYIATAEVDPSDLEWQERIAKHRLRRPKNWQTLLINRELSPIIEKYQDSNCLLIDSLGTWVANFLDQDDTTWEKNWEQLLTSLQKPGAEVIFVAEETGWGVVPAYKSGRLFRDRLGMLVRHLGAMATNVYLTTGGHVLNLSLLGKPLPSKLPEGQ